LACPPQPTTRREFRTRRESSALESAWAARSHRVRVVSSPSALAVLRHQFPWQFAGRAKLWRNPHNSNRGAVDSELSCPVLVAHQMSASSGFVLPCGTVGKADALSTFPRGSPPSGFKRRISHLWSLRSSHIGRCSGAHGRGRRSRPGRLGP
jgi:hypothetical protein